MSRRWAFFLIHKNSEVRLKRIEVTSTNTIEADFTLGGYLKFPWRPKIETVSGMRRQSTYCLYLVSFERMFV